MNDGPPSKPPDSRDLVLARFQLESRELVAIAHAMSTTRDVSKLLALILEAGRRVTGADAASLYVVELDDDDHDPSTPSIRRLRFKLTQNESRSFDSREFVLPLSTASVAGCAAFELRAINLEDVYALPEGTTFAFDRRFDERIGYRTRSMLAMPLVSQQGEAIGVIQLINKKREPLRKLVTLADVDEQVVPFDAHSEELLGMVAAQAAASLESALLYEEIRGLFDGFVMASVEAIEQRDPTTSGHSRRVANLSLGLARAVSEVSTGPYAGTRFGSEALRELEYASLLHDFGKIGVRENVLVKAKKLEPEALARVRTRFDLAARGLESHLLTSKIRLLERGAPREEFEALEVSYAMGLARLDEGFAEVLLANEPALLLAEKSAALDALSRETYLDRNGDTLPLLTQGELAALQVPRGSLTSAELDEIRAHVTHTFRFLSKIPWGKSLRRVPQIAGAHHERVNGTGYPHGIPAAAIPVESKVMSIADIYDALTASDRPYKKAVPVERALGILDAEVRDGHLDADLVAIFRNARIWEHAEATER